LLLVFRPPTGTVGLHGGHASMPPLLPPFGFTAPVASLSPRYLPVTRQRCFTILISRGTHSDGEPRR